MSAAMKTLTSARLTDVSSVPVHAGSDRWPWMRFDLVDVGGEQQERRQRGGRDRVALGERLGRVADRVEAVGDLAGLLSAWLNSAMPPALSVIGPKVSMARMKAVVISMPIVATAVPKMPPTSAVAVAAWPAAEPVAGEERDADGDGGERGASRSRPRRRR